MVKSRMMMPRCDDARIGKTMTPMSLLRSAWCLLLFLPSSHPSLISFQVGSRQPSRSWPQNCSPKEELDRLLEDPTDSTVQDLRGGGYCNSLYMVQQRDRRLVAKLFSGLALKRMHTKYEVDLLAGQAGVGPQVHATTDNGILMDWVEGNVLDEVTIHADNVELIRSIADSVKTLHQLEQPPSPPHMLWHCLNVMLSITKEEHRVGELRKHYELQRQCLEPLDLPVVLGHGDMKPSNIMLATSLSPSSSAATPKSDDDDGRVLFIDFETSGMHYRGFDIAKIFRTQNPTDVTKANMREFANVYTDSNEREMESVLLEAALLQPMTDPENEEKWSTLAQDRLTHYEESMANFEHNLEAYQGFVSQ